MTIALILSENNDERVELTNSQYLNQIQLESFSNSFKELSSEEQYIFELYNFIVYGMKTENGSMGNIVSNKLIKEYSYYLSNNFMNEFKENFNMFMRNLLVTPNSILKIRTNSENNINIPIIRLTSRSGMTSDIFENTKGETKRANVISSSLYNPFIANDMVSHHKVFNFISKYDMDTLMKNGYLSLHLKKNYLITENLFTNDKISLLSGSIVKLQNGLFAKVSMVGKSRKILKFKI